LSKIDSLHPLLFFLFMLETYIGSIMIFAGNYAPRGWAICDGSILSIPTNTALFSILGTTYGGNGTTTFGLPDFRGRAPVSSGQFPGRHVYSLGEQGGVEQVTLTVAQLPAHNHTITVPTGEAVATSDTPNGNILTAAQSGNFYANVSTADNEYGGVVTGATGNNQPFDVRPPSVVLNYIICLQGIYPPRQ
jgi:microcystin-dependent protein